MQSTDRLAADLVLAFLEDKGLSPEAFSKQAFNAGHGFVSGKTIRRIVEDAIVPGTVRVRATVAAHMGRAPSAVWRNAPVVAGRTVNGRRRVAA